MPASAAVALHGFDMDADRVDLGDGFSLVRAARLDTPLDPDGVACVFERDVAPGDDGPGEDAAGRCRELVTALRLKPGGVALGAVGWRRSGESRWTPFEIRADGPARASPADPGGGRREGPRRVPGHGPRDIAGGRWPGRSRASKWAARGLDAEALPDYLLALRALLDAGGEAGLASLGLRVAALCAEEGERRVLQRRVEDALSLERYVMGGGRGEELGDWIGSQRRASWWPSSSATFARAAARHPLRLPGPRAQGGRRRDPPRAEHGIGGDRGARPAQGAETDELEPVAPKPRPRRITAELRSHPEGVTESADWGPLDEDPESYSAPV